jgi:hypothetical protein
MDIPKPSEIRTPHQMMREVKETEEFKLESQEKKQFIPKPHLTQRLGGNADLQIFRNNLKKQ